MLGLAEYIANWSKDPHRRVGAVIADKANRVISLGYNGFPRGVHDALLPKEEKLQRTIHAEVNAILHAKQDLSDCTLYIYPCFPCSQCAALIIQSGICRVVCNDIGTNPKWNTTTAIDLFNEANVHVEIYTGESFTIY